MLGFPEYENNQIRKKIYREAVFIIHGFLAKNQRRKLPSCVVDGMRSLCPSSTYMVLLRVNPRRVKYGDKKLLKGAELICRKNRQNVLPGEDQQ
jgi:hypothetical protein